jgi:CMP-2-keto-3-deoxyoctulosonic acid synthetase
LSAEVSSTIRAWHREGKVILGKVYGISTFTATDVYKKKFSVEPELDDENIVKCLSRLDGTIMNIMRKSSSVASKEIQKIITEKICGIYGISNSALQKLVQNGPTRFEKSESIEQMRALELGLSIQGVRIERNYPSVNTIEEALQVEQILENDNLQRELLKAVNAK